MASDPGSPPAPDGAARALPDLSGFPTRESLASKGGEVEEEALDEARRPIRCPAPARPRWLDGVIMAVLVGSPYLLMGVAEAGEELVGSAGLPPALLGGLVTGCGAVLLAAIALLLHAHATRYRAAFISDEGIILGPLEPTPRGTWLRWGDLVGFRVGSGRIVLAVRAQPWTRWLGPIIDCDDDLLHRVVVRLEARGIRRLDG